MFAGKSTDLLAKYDRAVRWKRPTLVIRPAVDSREPLTHAGREIPYVTVESTAALDELLFEDVLDQDGTYLGERTTADVLLVDEVQFFDQIPTGAPETLSEVLERARRRGVAVTAYGLDLDALGKPWRTTQDLMAIADQVRKLTAVCPKCGEDAPLTQRTAPWSVSPERAVGGASEYEARCRACWCRPATPPPGE